MKVVATVSVFMEFMVYRKLQVKPLGNGQADLWGAQGCPVSLVCRWFGWNIAYYWPEKNPGDPDWYLPLHSCYFY